MSEKPATTPAHKPADKPAARPAGTPAATDPKTAKPKPGEIGGPEGPEPTRYGDWERKGRVSDF